MKPSRNKKVTMQPEDGGAWNNQWATYDENFFSSNPFNDGRGSGLYTDFSKDASDLWNVPPPFGFAGPPSLPPPRQRGQGGSRDGGAKSKGGKGKGKGKKQQNFTFGNGDNKYRWQRITSQQVGLLGDYPGASGNAPGDSSGQPQRPHSARSNRSSGSSNEGANSRQWSQFTKQFGTRHFHRDSSTESDKSRQQQASLNNTMDSDLSSSGGAGRKRPRSLDRESVRQISKSSRGESLTRTRQFGGISPAGSRTLSLTDLSSGESLDSNKAKKSGQVGANKSAVALAKGFIATGKKKAANSKKFSVNISGAKAGSKSSGGAADGEAQQTGEGVLERAERMCRELREKRQQAGKAATSTATSSSGTTQRASTGSQRAALLKNALNASSQRFNSAHKSFIKGYFSDSSARAPSAGSKTSSDAPSSEAVPNAPKVTEKSISSSALQRLSSSASALDAQKTVVSSRSKAGSSVLSDNASTSSGPSRKAASSSASTAVAPKASASSKSNVSNNILSDNTSTSSSTSKRTVPSVGNSGASQAKPSSDIERLRQSIESSVMAERGRTAVRERTTSSGAGSRSPAASSRLPSSLPGANPTANKPPLKSLSKEALARMVNAPRSRTQRTQLARILRQHSTDSANKPRRIQLDGVYDQAASDDGDSIHDVLRNFGLEELGDCVELQNIKLEDLTSEDKLRIAQLIEDVDLPDRLDQPQQHGPGPLVSARRQARRQSSHTNLSDKESDNPTVLEFLSSDARLSSPLSRPHSPSLLQRVRSPSPSRPLSLHDLDTAAASAEHPSSGVIDVEMAVSDTYRSSQSRARYKSPVSSSPRHSVVASPPRPQTTSPAGSKVTSPQRTQVSSPQRMQINSPNVSRSVSPSRLNATEAVTGSRNVIHNAANSIDVNQTAADSRTQQSGGRMSPPRHRSPSPTRPLTSYMPMEVSDSALDSSNAIASGLGLDTRSVGVLHEVMGLCQQQDTVLSQMRNIDVELSQMYKSLIEIVARMSSLQRKRVELQSQSEQLGQQRNQLLTGLTLSSAVPTTGSSLNTTTLPKSSATAYNAVSTAPSTVTNQGIDSTNTSNFTDRSMGSSVTLPRWLTATASSAAGNFSNTNNSSSVTANYSSSSAASSNIPSSLGSFISSSNVPANLSSVLNTMPALLSSSVAAIISSIPGSINSVPSAAYSSNSTTMNSVSAGRQAESVSTMSEMSDICLSGSMTGSHGTNTPLASSQNTPRNSVSENTPRDSSFQNVSRESVSLNAVGGESASRSTPVENVSMYDAGLGTSIGSRPSSSGASAGGNGPRSMLNLGAAAGLDKGNTESQGVFKTGSEVENSSGMGSSVSTLASQRQQQYQPQTSLPVISQYGLPSSVASVSYTSSSSTAQYENVALQSNAITSQAQPGRLLFSSFGSPTAGRGGGSGLADVASSPGLGVAYLGSLSSELVQQIVRNLPLTSQLGEVRGTNTALPPSSSMFTLNTTSTASTQPQQTMNSESVDNAEFASPLRMRSFSTDKPAPRSRIRTTSLHSIGSDPEQQQTSFPEVPPLQLPSDRSERDRVVSFEGDGEHDEGLWEGREGGWGSKAVTPRSESDAQSGTSGTSLGEQIKLFSERNTSSDLSFLNMGGDDLREFMQCSVVMEKLNLPENNVVILEDWHGKPKVDKVISVSDLQAKAKEEKVESDRPRRRKSKKDRDQSLHRRRPFVIESSSEGEGEEDGSTEDGKEGVESGSRLSGLSGGVERMEEDGDLDSTLVGSDGRPTQDPPSDTEVPNNAASTASTISSSRLKLRSESLQAFRASLTSLGKQPSTENSMEVELATPATSVAKKDSLRINGPCASVMGLEVAGSLLYAGFQGVGVNSYTMEGRLSDEYSVAGACCFTLSPLTSINNHYVIIGAECQLTFFHIASQSVTVSLDTVAKVMCVLLMDSMIFAGLDTGFICVVSLKTLQETRRFQASDCPIHTLTWTREGSTRLLCVASQDAAIHVIDSASGLPVRIISGHAKTAFSLCMSSHLIVSGSGDRKVMAHNVHTAGLVWELQDHTGIVTSVCIDNRLLFSGGYDKIIRCYEIQDSVSRRVSFERSCKLLHLLYGAGKGTVMKMAVHNSVLFTGNRDGQVEAIDLRDLGSFACQCVSCGLVFGLKEHLWHHIVADHLLPNTKSMRCPWKSCNATLNTGSALVKAGEHMRNHIDS